MSYPFRVVLLAMLCAGAALPGHAQTPLNQRVLVVYNATQAQSAEVANYYAAQRGIPAANLCAISPTSTTALSWAAYDTTVRTPVRNCLQTAGAGNILYIVFSYLTPFKLVAPDGGTYSLDQYVADIWDQYLPAGQYGLPSEAQPYFAEAQSQGNGYPAYATLADYASSQDALNVYSVWRLDGATASAAKALVDKALTAEQQGLSGTVCIDRRYTLSTVRDYGYGSGDFDLRMAAQFAALAGFSVVEDDNSAEFGTAPAPLRCDGAALYAGWYSYGNYNDAFTWVPGAIGFHLDSASASDPRAGSNWSANALAHGITVTSGAVTEPYLDGMAHPDIVFRSLFQGANVGDAFLRAERWLKWMLLNIGDPLYRPFPSGFAAVSAQPNQLLLDPQYLIGGTGATAAIRLAAAAPEAGCDPYRHQREAHPGHASRKRDRARRGRYCVVPSDHAGGHHDRADTAHRRLGLNHDHQHHRRHANAGRPANLAHRGVGGRTRHCHRHPQRQGTLRRGYHRVVERQRAESSAGRHSCARGR